MQSTKQRAPRWSPPDRFSFSHALIRSTLYEELNSARRARLHRKVGVALEELTQATPGTRIDELAHHWLNAAQAADIAKTIGYVRQAGDHALANLAFEEAAAYFERALAVLEARADPGDGVPVAAQAHDRLLADAVAAPHGWRSTSATGSWPSSPARPLPSPA